jgi:uncharacterized protein YjiK
MLVKMCVLSAAVGAAASADISSLDLAAYELQATYPLPPIEALEASAVTFNWDTGTLFVLGDEGTDIAEVTLEGVLVSSMTLSGFDDTEGLTYLGKGRFVLVEEREQDACLIEYQAGGSADRGSVPSVSLGDNIGNVGLEGLSFDPLNGTYVIVKEKTPSAVYEAKFDFDAGEVSFGDLFDPVGLGVSDLSDVQTLTTVASLIGTEDQDNLLIYSQESAILLEVARDGTVLSKFDFSSLSDSAEGVTIDGQGTIYVCDESPTLFVLRPKGGCRADIDGNGALELFDFLGFVNLFNAGDAAADFDGNGLLELFDFLGFVNEFNAGC